MTETLPHCQGTRKNGEPCRAQFDLSSAGLCLMHDPNRAEQPNAKRAKAGKPKSRSNQKAYIAEDVLPALLGALETIEDCKKAFRQLVVWTVTGDLDAVAAREATKQVLNLRLALRDEQNTEKRLKALERSIAAAAGKRDA